MEGQCFSKSAEYFVLVRGEDEEAEFYVEFDEDGNPITTYEMSSEVWTDPNDERLGFMLVEYEERLEGFRVVKVKETVQTSFHFEE